MKRIQLNFEQQAREKLDLVAHIKQKSLAEVVRDYVDEGLRNEKIISDASGLLELADLAEKENWSGPIDLAEKHDTYFADAYEEGREL